MTHLSAISQEPARAPQRRAGPGGAASAIADPGRRQSFWSPATCPSSGPGDRAPACCRRRFSSRFRPIAEQVFLGTSTVARSLPPSPRRGAPTLSGRPRLHGRRTCARSPCRASSRRGTRHPGDGEVPARLAPAPPLLRQLRRAHRCVAQAGFRRDCPACGTQHFPRTDPVVIMLVTAGDKCLLGRQPRFEPRNVFVPRGVPGAGRDHRGRGPARDLRGGRRPRRRGALSARPSPGRFRPP